MKTHVRLSLTMLLVFVLSMFSATAHGDSTTPQPKPTSPGGYVMPGDHIHHDGHVHHGDHIDAENHSHAEPGPPQCGVRCTKNSENLYRCNAGGIFRDCWTNSERTTCLVAILCNTRPGIIETGPTPLLTPEQIRQIATVNSVAAGVLARVRELLMGSPSDDIDPRTLGLSYSGRAYTVSDVETLLGNDAALKQQLEAAETVPQSVEVSIETTVDGQGVRTIVLKTMPGTNGPSWASTQTTVVVATNGTTTTTMQ